MDAHADKNGFFMFPFLSLFLSFTHTHYQTDIQANTYTHYQTYIQGNTHTHYQTDIQANTHTHILAENACIICLCSELRFLCMCASFRFCSLHIIFKKIWRSDLELISWPKVSQVSRCDTGESVFMFFQIQLSDQALKK